MTKISALPAAVAAANADQLEVNQSGVSRRLTVDQISERVAASDWIQDQFDAVSVASGLVNVRSFGAVGDGVTDDTAAIRAATEAAITANATVFCPAGKYRLTGRIQPTAPVTIEGETPTATIGAGPNTAEHGTWFFLDHLDYGFKYRDDATLASYSFCVLRNIGTYRPQPAAGPGWAPDLTRPHDIYTEWNLLLDNVFLLNPTKGVLVRGAGVLQIDRLRGQPLLLGIECERSSDVQDWRNVHWWPYWSQHADVALYTLTNCNGMLIKRSDGLNVTDYFTILCRRSVYMVEDVSLGGAVGAFNFVNLISDIGGGSIEITSAATGVGHWGNFVNVMNNGDAALRVSAVGVLVTGPVVNRINITNLHNRRSGLEAIKTSGAAHVVRVSVGHFSAYNAGATGVACISADDGASVLMTSTPTFTSATNPVYNTNTSGIIRAPVMSGAYGVGGSLDVQLDLIANNNAGPALNKLRFTDQDLSMSVGQYVGQIEYYTNDSSAPGARVGASFGVVAESTAPQFAFVWNVDSTSGTATERARLSWRGLSVVSGGFGRGAPVVKTANFTVATTENWLAANRAGLATTVTLPTASDFIGREIMITNYQAQVVVSISANVVPLGGGAAATAILSANVGRWCVLVSDGTNWVTTMGVI